jgi:regulator of protease activity HflC (stomatin/prohibitin superfamily)
MVSESEVKVVEQCGARNIMHSRAARALMQLVEFGGRPREERRGTARLTARRTLRAGKYSFVGYPGCVCVNPLLCNCVSGTLSMRLQQMEVSCDTKTKDNVFVNIRVAVQYQINSSEESIKSAKYRLTNARSQARPPCWRGGRTMPNSLPRGLATRPPPAQIESYVFDVVRSSVPKIDLDDVFTTKEEISNSVKAQLTEAMSDFGYTIIAAPIIDIDPDAQVKRAMNEINKQKRLRVAAQDEGEVP